MAGRVHPNAGLQKNFPSLSPSEGKKASVEAAVQLAAAAAAFQNLEKRRWRTTQHQHALDVLGQQGAAAAKRDEIRPRCSLFHAPLY